MLDERLERLARIGSRKSFSFVAHWLSFDTITVDSLKKIAKSSGAIDSTEIEPILWLFCSMGQISISNDNPIIVQPSLTEEFKKGEDSFSIWFIDRFVEFCLDHDIIDTTEIKYSIAENAYIMTAAAIKPSKHACYRNILTEYDVITFLPNGRYRINAALDHAINAPKIRKKITEKQLLARLEKQREQGEKGELFVLEYEKKRITNPSKQSQIKRISVIDVAAGFDIVSFNDNNSPEPDRFIEVKTYKGDEHFILSHNEKLTASFVGDSYYIYLVNIDYLNKEGYEPEIIKNPEKEIFNSGKWLIEADSYRISNRNSDNQGLSSVCLEHDE